MTLYTCINRIIHESKYTIVFMIMSIIVVTIISGIYTPSNAQATSVVSNDTTNSQSSGSGSI